MIEHELLLLGLLKESPKHGYEIKTKIKEIINLFAGLDVKSVYYPLSVLESKGLISKRISKQGRRPERLVYCLTSLGEKRFNELLAKSFLNFKRPQFSLDLSLYFLHYINPAIARRRLHRRMLVLNKLSKDLKQMSGALEKKRNSPLLYILEHNLQMVDTESRFLLNLIQVLSA